MISNPSLVKRPTISSIETCISPECFRGRPKEPYRKLSIFYNHKTLPRLNIVLCIHFDAMINLIMMKRKQNFIFLVMMLMAHDVLQAQSTPEAFLSQLPSPPSVNCAADRAEIDRFDN